MPFDSATNLYSNFKEPIRQLPYRLVLGCLSLLAIFPESLLANEKSLSILIDTADLQKRLGQKNLKLIDTRSLEDYAKGHIRWAGWVDVSVWKALGKSPGGFENSEAWGNEVQSFGIDHDSQVVVYGSTLSDTARIWWILKYLGLKQVMILDGGWDAWVEQKRPTSRAVTRVIRSNFVPKFQADRLETIDTLKKSVADGKVTVVDTRSDDEFSGKEVRGKRGGHIPGAAHLEWKELLAADGRFKSRKKLRELFAERGILPTETAVCY